eukprot:CAMPEP_0173137788 /NCGR_PEP_ID=MMETSP1105-20130129/3300_1 /TAXON_ID=2985 /ORGANISM="Ochromonas sp., Strain BG-1" /LENGTH=677 /DNA_ID=CAMNT_0014050253 /DNA_START=325 /DNA_END=2358 /DNA_ORIENTATION=+
MESPTKKKKSDHHTDELLNPFSPFPSPFPFTSSTPLTTLINEGVMTPFLTGMTPSIHENHQVPSSRDWTPSMRESIAEGFELQHAMSPPAHKQRNNRGKRDSAHINVLASPLFPDLSEADGIFDTEAQTQLMKNKEALANRIKATETNHSKPHFPHSKKNGHGLSDNNKITLGDMQALSKSSLLGEVMNPSSTASVYKYGIAEKSLFSGIESLSSSQQSDNSGLAAITAAADNLPPLEINTNLPSPIVKTAISHPKKQRLKTKEDTDFSAPSSPLKQPHSLSSFASSNNNNNSSQPLLAAFSRNNSTSSQPTITSLSSTPYRSKSLNTMEDKAKIEEIIQIGIARAAQQRADDIKTVTCNCKKSKCLKMYCDCFRLTEYCKKTCNCYECNNTEMYEESRQLAIRSITERNPEAFKPRVITEEENNNSKSHLTGCHCRKSACLKKYCECFTGNVPCTNRCRCIDCKNVPELYHLDESIRKQAFALTQSASSASKSSTTARTPSSSARAQQQTLFNSPRGKDLPNTKLSFNEHPAASSGNRIVESDHSNLTTSTLYSTDGSVLAASTTTKDEPVSINVTSPHRPKYKAMTSPELRGLSAFDIRQTAESVGSESTNTERSRKIDDYTPSSPLKTSSNHNNNNTNDALLSPIKLLELADVAMNIQEFVLSSQLSDNLTPDD